MCKFVSATVLLTTLLLFLVSVSFTHAQIGDQITENLSLGDTGEQVRLLQELLNRTETTKVAQHGPGSPGQETTYFGPLTHSAVIRFQELHRGDVLVPVGLYFGTGFVGPLTRAKLNSLFAESRYQASIKGQRGETGDFQELHLKTILDLGEEQGLSRGELSRVESEVKEVFATTTNLVARFSQELKTEQANKMKRSSERAHPLAIYRPEPTPLAVFADTYQMPDFDINIELTQSVLPRPACSDGIDNDGDGFIDLSDIGCEGPNDGEEVFRSFGGRIISALPCTCTAGAVWNVAVAPAKPVVADYVTGSQAFQWFNIPIPLGIAALGKYLPYGQTLSTPPICLMGVPPACFPLPSAGIITPVAGSSLVPPESFPTI